MSIATIEQTKDSRTPPKVDRGAQVIGNIKRLIEESNINRNDFYKVFRSRRFTPAQLKWVFQQYYYYIRTFPQILAGTSHHVDNELVRMKLARTVVSELGDGIGKAHFLMFEDVLRAVGVTLDDWKGVNYIPEASDLVRGLRTLFLEKPATYSIGAHYVIEEFGLPMIVALYEGFRQYDGWRHEDFGYFYLHMLVEGDHVAWITAAVKDMADSDTHVSEIEDGAREVLVLLNNFWSGLARIAAN